MKKISLMMCLLSIALIQSALGFNDNRQGFIIGLGAGFQSSEMKLEKEGVNAGIDFDGKLATSFKIGYGFNDKFLLHYTNDVSWVKLPKNSDLLALGITALAGTYYFNNQAPSAFITAGYGVGALKNSNIANAKKDDLLGSGWILGGGYEFENHINVELSMFKNDFSRDPKIARTGINTYMPSIRLTINYLWY